LYFVGKGIFHDTIISCFSMISTGKSSDIGKGNVLVKAFATLSVPGC
jgi:hypothetical protein